MLVSSSARRTWITCINATKLLGLLLLTLAHSLVVTGIASACDVVNFNYHAFDPGTPLVGLGGGQPGVYDGQWVGNWVNTSGDAQAITVDNSGKISVGTTGSEAVAISRSMSYSKDNLSSLTFTTEFMEVQPNELPYTMSVQFGNAAGGVVTKVAEFGIGTDESGVHKFFGGLGNSVAYADSSQYPISPNTYYSLFGRIDFNVENSLGQHGQQVTIWVNPKYSDVLNDNYAARVFDTTSFTDIGNLVTLFALNPGAEYEEDLG